MEVASHHSHQIVPSGPTNGPNSYRPNDMEGESPLIGVARPNKSGASHSGAMIPYNDHRANWHNHDSEWEDWCKVESDLKRARLGRIGELGKDSSSSPTVPQTFEEYKEHKREWQAMQKLAFQRKLDFAVEDARVNRQLQLPKFDLSDMPCEWDGRGTVLGFPTIWTSVHLDGHPTREEAPWPSKEELSEEGDERHTSHFNRFLPLPRFSSNTTVNWKQKPFMQAERFDRVRPIPGNKMTYPGLLFDRLGKPYDDESQSGRTAYVEKNPFDPLAQLEYEMQKCDLNQQKSLLRSFSLGSFQRSITPPHPLANLGNAAALVTSPHNIPGIKSVVSGLGLGTAMANNSASPSSFLHQFSVPSTSAVDLFNYDPHVQEFVPEMSSSPSDMRENERKPAGVSTSPIGSEIARLESGMELLSYTKEPFVSEVKC